MKRFRSDEITQIGVVTRQSGTVEHVQDINFVLMPHHRRTPGAVDADARLNPAEKMVGRKSNIVADIIVAISSPPRCRTVQAHPGIVKDFGAIINDSRAEMFLAHYICGVEQKITIGVQLDQAQLVYGQSRSLGVSHLVKRSRIGPLGWSRRGRAESVQRSDIKLHDLSGSLTRNGPHPCAVGLQRHRETCEH